MNKIKIALIAFFATLIITGTTVYASFPVKNNTNTEQVTNQNNTTTLSPSQVQSFQKETTISADIKGANGMDQETIITLVLWFFLGGLAAHRWYKGKPAGWNILFILTAGGCGIWAIIDLINILTGDF